VTSTSAPGLRVPVSPFSFCSGLLISDFTVQFVRPLELYLDFIRLARVRTPNNPFDNAWQLTVAVPVEGGFLIYMFLHTRIENSDLFLFQIRQCRCGNAVLPSGWSPPAKRPRRSSLTKLRPMKGEYHTPGGAAYAGERTRRGGADYYHELGRPLLGSRRGNTLDRLRVGLLQVEVKTTVAVRSMADVAAVGVQVAKASSAVGTLLRRPPFAGESGCIVEDDSTTGDGVGTRHSISFYKISQIS